MNVRGPILSVGDEREAGGTTLVEVTIKPDRGAGAATTVTLWRKWTETAAYAEPGMELLVTDVGTDEYRGETTYETTPESWVVLEPDFLVDVTDVRSWVQCPRMYYLNKLSGIPLNYPVVKGTIVHEVFGDLLRGVSLDESVADRVEEAGLELGLLGRSPEAIKDEVRRNAAAIEGWLQQGRLPGIDEFDGDESSGTYDGDEPGDESDGDEPNGQTELGESASTDDADDSTEEDGGSWTREDAVSEDDREWRSERTLVGPRVGIKGRADAIRRGNPVELKTGKNTNREPRFQDKVQAACYALLLRERGIEADTGTLLYTKNAALDRGEADGDLSPAKEFSIGRGLLRFVVRTRNEIAAMEAAAAVPTGYEADAVCEYCFEQDTCLAVSGRLAQESKAGQIGTPVPAHERRYFDRFYRALAAERDAVQAEYRKLWEQSASERADDDRALIELTPHGRRRLPNGRWALAASAPEDAVSKLRVGDVALASDGDPVAGDAELGRIERLGDATTDTGASIGWPGTGSDESDSDDSDGRPVIVTADEPVTLRRLDVYPSELSIDRSLTALHDAILTGDERRKDVLFGRCEPSFDGSDEPVLPDPAGGDAAGDGDTAADGGVDTSFVGNNPAQNRAVEQAVTADDLALIHGPPGTGKTFTIGRTIRELVARGERVLLAGFTNRAVDNALGELREQGLADALSVRAAETDDGQQATPKTTETATGDPTAASDGVDPEEKSAFARGVVRVGTESGVRGDMQNVRLVRRGDPVERAGELTDAPIVAATTAACGSRELREQSFDVALVDEASQLTEPATLAATELADRFVLVGDHRQLPPVVQNESGQPYETPRHSGGDSADERDLAEGGSTTDQPDDEPSYPTDRDEPPAELGQSLFERLIGRYPSAATMLDRQYRMSQRIQAFPSAEFYDGQLRPAAGAVAGQTLGDIGVDPADLPSELRDGVNFVDPDGTREGNRNPREAGRVASVVDSYVAAGVDPDDIGVIAPFRAQVAEISRRTDVTVDTVDRFQGSAKEVIVVSFVATDSLESPIFEDERRVNVALTRAKRALTLVGSADALSSRPVYDRMLSWATR